MSSSPWSHVRTPSEALQYWETRARSFAAQGGGLRAVCSYGMPWFYNAEIHLTQILALSPHLHPPSGTSVLDLGCGVGRWSRFAARRGARVVGVDLSPTMIVEARRRASRDDLMDHCRFLAADINNFRLRESFGLIVAVTVLQHILDERRLDEAILNIRRHLAPGGRAVILEAAPSRRDDRCDTPVFRARTAEFYAGTFEKAGLRTVAMSGVDPAPFKNMMLPRYSRLPAGWKQLAALAVTAASLPIEAIFGRRMTTASWHKVFVLEHTTR